MVTLGRPDLSTPPPAVLLVAEGGDAGGIGRYCVDLAGAMGDRARVVCLCPVPCTGGDSCWLAAQCAKRSVHLETVAMPAKAWRSGLIHLLRIWRRMDQPLLHVNGRRGNAVALVARLLTPGLRYVTTVHGVLGLHARRNAIYRLVDLAAGRAAWAVIAVSLDTQRRLLRARSPRATTHVVANALAAPDMAAFREVADRRWRENHDDGPLRIGFLGRLSAEKGTRELLEAATSLHAHGARATVAIAGDGPDHHWMVPESRVLIDDGFVSFHGEVRDPARFLAEIDVLVVPSRNEGLPYVLLEAMAAGCAVVAFKVGGIPEVVCLPSLGVLVRPGDVDGLCAALGRLCDDRAVVRALGRAASDHIVEHYALESRLPLLSQIYGIDVAPHAAADDPLPRDRPD
jgi:glycosyltransferase involved in cell wall biosynthesis